MSCANGLPVRVTRGAEHRSPDSPAAGYRYGGLYRVEDYWAETGKSGFRIWRFRLVRVAADAPAATPLPDGTLVPERASVTIQRIARSSAVAQAVKQLHEHRCQVCGIRLETKAGPYSEAAHIVPLGEPHCGPDVPETCSACALTIMSSSTSARSVVGANLDILDMLSTTTVGMLRVHPAHEVDAEALAHHLLRFLPD